MKIEQIKRFFAAYGYPIEVDTQNGEIVSVYNKQFAISKEGTDYWFDGYQITGAELVYHFEADQDCLYSMIICGWSLTKDIFDEMNGIEVDYESEAKMCGKIKI